MHGQYKFSEKSKLSILAPVMLGCMFVLPAWKWLFISIQFSLFCTLALPILNAAIDLAILVIRDCAVMQQGAEVHARDTREFQARVSSGEVLGLIELVKRDGFTDQNRTHVGNLFNKVFRLWTTPKQKEKGE
jgi:hypothetical protein